MIISALQEDGWIIIQRRVDASVSFERSWDEYAAGFGDVDGNFWLGLDTIHDLTEAQPMRLQIDVVPFNLPAVLIPYPYFHVGDAASDYLLNITSDTLDDETLYNYINFYSGIKFSNYDRYFCAEDCRAGWWFSRCDRLRLNLNGVYGGAGEISLYNIFMYGLSDNVYEPIRTVTMKIRTSN